MSCEICGGDEKYIEGLEDELAKLRAWKHAVVGALNPMRPGDDVTFWGHDLGDPAVAVRCIESIRRQRDARDEGARISAEAIQSLRDACDHWAARAKAAEAEVERLEGLILDAESDIKAMGMEAHPAVLMRMDQLARRIRAALRGDK